MKRLRDDYPGTSTFLALIAFLGICVVASVVWEPLVWGLGGASIIFVLVGELRRDRRNLRKRPGTHHYRFYRIDEPHRGRKYESLDAAKNIARAIGAERVYELNEHNKIVRMFYVAPGAQR